MTNIHTPRTPTANVQYGLPLDEPSKQTILPVYCGGQGNMMGWLSIQSTTFDGTETSFTTADGPIPVTTVTLPHLVINDDLKRRVQQFMAVVFDDDDYYRKLPWLGYSAFVNTNESAYAMQWFQPTMGSGYRFNRGPLFTDLTVRMDADNGTPPAPIPDPSVTPGTLRWVVNLKASDLSAGCGFIDFNWVELFHAQTQDIDPLRIEIVSNPPSGEFKTTIVPYPVVSPLGAIEFNTLRLINLKPADPGDYVFNYKVVDSRGHGTPVVLTLTAV